MAVADSAVVAGAAIVAAVAVAVEAVDAEIAGNSNRVFTTRAAGPVGMPRFFWWAREPVLRMRSTRACRSRIKPLPSSGLAFSAR